MKIPKIIIQTWKQQDLPPGFQHSSSQVRALHRGWTYLFFDDQQLVRFVQTQFPDLWDVFENFPYNIQRIDFFRLLAVYHYGGFYLDMDMELTQSLDTLRNRSCVFPFELASGENIQGDQLGQYAFGASPRHPFVGAIIENIRVQRFNTSGMTLDKFVLFTTGPVLVTQTLKDHPELADTVQVLRPDPVLYPNTSAWYRFGDYGRHKMASTWHKEVVGSRISETEFICDDAD